jgi:C4-dicarboxylate-specific signal transduction histidine kinase
VNDTDRLRGQLSRREKELDLLEQFSQRLAGSETESGVWNSLTRFAKDLLDFETLAIFGQDLEPVLVEGQHQENAANALLLGLEEPILEETFQRGCGLLEDYSRHAPSARMFEGEATSATFLVGSAHLLYLGSTRAQAFSAWAFRLLTTLARQAGLALVSAQRLQSLNSALGELQQAYGKLEESEMGLVQAGKLAAVGQLAAGVAHELNTPLATVLLEVEGLEMDLEPDPDVNDTLQKITRELLRAQEIVHNLLYYSRDAAKGDKPTELNQVVRESLELVSAQLRQDNIQVGFQAQPGELWFQGNGNEIQQILLNLLLNARDALKGKQNRLVTVKTLNESDRLELLVIDNGDGVSAECVDKVFDPFFTTKPVGQGTGLGLSVSRRLAERHNGTLELIDGDGGCFALTLPPRDGRGE